MSGKKLIKISIIALVIVFLNNVIIGVVLGVGLKYYFFDTLHHYAGGFFVALFFYGYLYEIVSSPSIRTIKKWLVIISATLFVGVLWEFTEFIGTVFIGDYLAKFGLKCCMGDLTDTVFDLFVDSLGAITLLGLLHNRFRREKS